MKEEEVRAMEGRQRVAGISKSMPRPNPITQLQTRFKELETGFKAWLAKQSLSVQATVFTATRAAKGVAERVAEISKFMPPTIPITHLQTSFKELETGFKAWLAKQSLPAQATIVTATRAAEGVAERVEEISKYMLSTNPITQLQTGFKEFETGFKAWLADQSLLVEVTTRATIVVAMGATFVVGVGSVCFVRAIESCFSFFFSTPPPQAPLNLQAMSPFKLTQFYHWLSFVLPLLRRRA